MLKVYALCFVSCVIFAFSVFLVDLDLFFWGGGGWGGGRMKATVVAAGGDENPSAAQMDCVVL